MVGGSGEGGWTSVALRAAPCLCVRITVEMHWACVRYSRVRVFSVMRRNVAGNEARHEASAFTLDLAGLF